MSIPACKGFEVGSGFRAPTMTGSEHNDIYFYDGNKVFGDTDIYEMTVDGIHPTDLGFYTIANVLTPVIREILHRGHHARENQTLP